MFRTEPGEKPGLRPGLGGGRGGSCESNLFRYQRLFPAGVSGDGSSVWHRRPRGPRQSGSGFQLIYGERDADVSSGSGYFPGEAASGDDRTLEAKNTACLYLQERRL